MEAVFLKIVNLSITASWLVLAVLLVRILLRKAPKGINCLLWGLVALRLIFPFSIESALSLVPSAQPIPVNMIYEEKPQIASGIERIDQVINPILSESMTPAVGASVNPLQVWTSIFAWIWLVGVAGMLAYALISALILKSKLSTAIPLEKGIKQSEFIDSPFVFGIIQPVIYLPYGIAEADLAPVILHEKAHIRRRDHLWKPMAFLLLAVYWFHPLLWIAYILLCRDIEAACDERVIREMGEEERRVYASALLNCSVHKRMIAACPVAFGEVSVKNRVKSVMNYRKPAFWIVLLAVIACVVAAICFLTDPPKKDNIELANMPHCIGDKPILSESQPFLEFQLGEFPGCVFRWGGGSVSMQPAGEEERDLYTGMPICDLYTCDLTGDGRPELCSTIMEGSGLIDERIVIYDIAEKALYQIENRGEYDYSLSMENGKLMVTKCVYGSFERPQIVETAELAGYAQANWKRIDDPSWYFSGELNDTAGNDAIGGSNAAIATGGSAATAGSVVVDETAVDVSEPMSEIADITHIGTLTKASIVGGGAEFICTDEAKLAFLEELLQTAVVEMPTRCSYGECMLKLWDESGEISCVYPASDGCCMIIAGDNFFRYGSKPSGFDNSVDFWDIFGLTPHHAVEWATGGKKMVKEEGYRVTAASASPGQKFYGDCLDPGAMLSDSKIHFPVYRIDTREELESFRQKYADDLALDREYGEVASFDESIWGYDDAFFTEKSLIICYVQSYSGTYRYRVGERACENGTYRMRIERITTPGPINEEEAGWLVLVPVSDEVLAGCDRIEAYMLSQAELDARGQ